MKEWLLFMLFALFGGAVAFLPTSLDFENPELSDIFCPDQMTDRGWYLKAITREAIRLEVRNLFNEEPPSGSPGFNVPLDASLSEMFRLYYGQNASATRFYRAVNTIAWANAGVDSNEGTKYDSSYHFDGSQIEQGQALLANRHSLIVSSINVGQAYDTARELIGQSLHAIEDFYSHSTWIELGNKGIIDGLGIPGFIFDNVAGPGDQTCLPCSTADGVCAANVILGGKLTSGFYEYDVPEATSSIITKPDGAGKCSFGGKLDTSKSKDPIGGINKASTSPCFSSHNYRHFDAAELAIQASQNYLSKIRKAVGNEQFRFLLDLYQGSALCIVIDTTGSMGPELDAVKQQVQIIVDTTPADLYILVPYNDPDYGPLTSTTDPDEFMVAINALYTYNGGAEEAVWHGLQLALTNTPDYSTMYLFTDIGGNDAELMDGDFALAQEKNIVVTVVYSFVNYDSPDDGHANDDSKLLKSDVEDYKRLAAVTGGQFIEINSFTVEDVVTILGSGVEDSKVSLALRVDVTGDTQFDILVDDTVSVLEITISGSISSAILTDPTGLLSYDLMDQAALNSTSNVNVTTYSPTMKDIKFISPGIDYWNIQVSGSSVYSVFAYGASNLGYMVEFTDLDTRAPRPNYHLISGSPIAGLSYYVEIILVGWIENEVTSVTSMEFLDTNGNILSNVAFTGAVDDEIYIKSDPLPQDKFYVVTNGLLSSGNAFTRVYETLITPVSVSVSVNLTQSLMAGKPGSTSNNVFEVKNYGPDMLYTYYATDEEGYITTFSPQSSTINANGSESVVVTFYVPPTEVPWTRSTVIVTASSPSISYNINSDIAYFIVLPENRDTIPPTCISTDLPDCVGHQSSTTCDSGNWTVRATLHDEAGLANIYTQPANSQTSLDVPTTFSPGTTDDIAVTLTASCCVTKLQIIGVDQQGNIGTCNYDMGALDGVLTFEAIDEGSTWVYLRWTVDNVRSDLIKYTLVTDSFFANDVRCFDLTCYYNDTFLQPCSKHDFSLTPYFNEFGNGTLVIGETAITSDTTLDEVPGPPTNLGAAPAGTDGTAVDITWDPPSTNGACVALYEICAISSGGVGPICRTTTAKSYKLTGIEACTGYIITVTAQTSSGLISEPASISATTGDGAPGEPQNLRAVNATFTSVYLDWDPPITNVDCVVRYFVTWQEVSKSQTFVLPTVTAVPIATEATIGDLNPCTNYTFHVFAASNSNYSSKPAITYMSTEETDPTTPSTLEVQPQGTSSLYVTWDTGLATCISHYLLCITDPSTWTENCTDVFGSNFVITGLIPCTTYNIKVAAVSPGGIQSDYLRGSGSTEDAEPGTVSNLVVDEALSHSITISFDNPAVNPQCADWYGTKFIDMTDGTTYRHRQNIQAKSPDNTISQTGLNPCTDYWIMVRSESSSGLRSDFANTTSATLEDLPSAPQNLQIIGATTDSTISLRWFAPMSNSRCAVKYEIIWVSLTGGNGFYIMDAASDEFEFEYTIAGLTSCSIYSIGVSAITPSSVQGLSSSISDTTLC